MSAEIIFLCPHCRHSLSVDASAAGLVVDCPVCSKEITVPSESEAVVEAEADAGEEGSPPARGLPPRREAHSPERASQTVLPERRGERQRDLAAVARGGDRAGRVEAVRGGWQGFCPQCGDAFLFSAADARRGSVVSCVRCESEIRLIDGEPPGLELVVRSTRGSAGTAAVPTPSERHDHDLQAALAGEQISREQIEAAQDRARRMSGAKDEWLWLRVGILVLLLLLAVYLFVTLVNLRARRSAEPLAMSEPRPVATWIPA